MTDGDRRARIRTVHDHPEAIAAAIAPDNTESMATTIDGDAVVTTIERPTTGGLRTTVDDYVSNLTVAQRITDTTTRS
jgi:hypothetical protein